MLKACLASDWAPLVVIQSPTGLKHVRAAVGYDDDSGRVTLMDPRDTTRSTRARLSYTDFNRQWGTSKNFCLLVFPHYMSEAQIRTKLKRYLPEWRFDTLEIERI